MVHSWLMKTSDQEACASAASASSHMNKGLSGDALMLMLNS